MVNFVIKKSGNVEPYSEEKIRKSITISATHSNCADEYIPWIVDEVLAEIQRVFGNTEKVSTQEIRKTILKKLNAIAPDVVLEWGRYKK